MDTFETLTAARDRVKMGWIQNTLRSGSSVCALGGIAAVADNRSYTGIMQRRRANLVLHFALPPQWWALGVAAYNDVPWRSKKQVLRTYGRAIWLAERARNHRLRKQERRHRHEQQYDGLRIDDLGQIVQPTIVTPNLPQLPELLTVGKAKNPWTLPKFSPKPAPTSTEDGSKDDSKTTAVVSAR